MDELEGAWGDPGPASTPLIHECHALHRKPLLLLSDDELCLALSQRIGSPWMQTLVLLRLGENPLRGWDGFEFEHSFDTVLRAALMSDMADWGDQLPQLRRIASIVETLPDTREHSDLKRAYARFLSTA